MNETYDSFTREAYICEDKLESLGRMICSAEGGAESWNEINESLSHLRAAIRKAYHMLDN